MASLIIGELFEKPLFIAESKQALTPNLTHEYRHKPVRAGHENK
jgi:hypothetical protein